MQVPTLLPCHPGRSAKRAEPGSRATIAALRSPGSRIFACGEFRDDRAEASAEMRICQRSVLDLDVAARRILDGAERGTRRAGGHLAAGVLGQPLCVVRPPGTRMLGRPGHMAGNFKWVHNMAIDSKGTIYTAEVGDGRRVQKFKRAN